ncbi:MAG: hypothetical protein IPJ88_15825 [Myxococcales bacterium]|nr:MAG: hypothetical protein IPJ88_15825 [Myxococcales bacterium]
MEAKATTEGGIVNIEGSLASGQNAVVTFKTSQLRLSKVLAEAPDIAVSGSATVTASQPHPKLDIDVQAFEYKGITFPAFTMQGRILANRIQIDAMLSRHLAGSIKGQGDAFFNGRIRLELEANLKNIGRDPNVPSEIQADAKAKVAIDTLGSSSSSLEVRGSIALSAVHYRSIKAETLVFDGLYRGALRQPYVKTRLSGKGVRVGNYVLGDTELTIAGGPYTYAVEGRAGTPEQRRAEFAATIQASTDGYLLHAKQVVVSAAGGTWRGFVEGLTFHPGQDLVVERIVLANGTQRLQVSGQYRFDGTEEIEAQCRILISQAYVPSWQQVSNLLPVERTCI